MRKLLVGLLLIIAIIFVIYNKPDNIHFNRYTEEIKNISFDKLNIQQLDYEKINDTISTIDFTRKKLDVNNLINTIKIETMEKNIYTFKLYSNNIIKYSIDDKDYYSEYDINSIISIFEDINNKYLDTTFFTLNYYGIYNDYKDDNIIIDLEDANSVFELNSTEIMNNFKIYAIEYIDNDFETKELLYKKDSIKKDTNVLINKTLAEGTPNFKITWDTPYNYHIEVIATYNGKNGGINLIKTIKELK